MKFFIAISLLWTLQLHAQIGIGTVNPSVNAILDVSSTNKGLMLPRLTDTSNVSNASAGLVIFNMNTKGLAFHDGARWNNLLGNNASATDSVTYTITNAASQFVNGIFPLSALSNGVVSNGSQANFQDVSFDKPLDANSIGIARAVTLQPNTSTMVIEIKSYTPGAANPNFSIKLTTPKFVAYQVSFSSGLRESVSVTATIIGYKNWVTNTSFAYNLQTATTVSY